MTSNTIGYILIAILLSVLPPAIFAQTEDDAKDTETILIKKQSENIFQQSARDSLADEDGEGLRRVDPGPMDRFFYPWQDSAYVKALNVKIPPGSRFRYDLKRFAGAALRVKSFEQLTMDAIKKNLDLPKEYYQPSDVEMTAYQDNLRRASYIPGVNQFGTYGAGIKVSLQDAAVFLGLSPDLSPNITYELDFTANVTIVIYSVQAMEIATIFDNVQSPGKYKITWNGRDDNGRKVASGDYIAEVRIGDHRYMRKRIQIP